MRKFLNDLGYKDKDLPWNWNKGDERQEQWKKERKEYGFDERDTWTLRFTLALLVYERLKYYREYAPVEMDKKGLAHDFEFEGSIVTIGQALDRILIGFEKYLKSDDRQLSVDEYQEYQTCWALLGVIMPSLWW